MRLCVLGATGATGQLFTKTALEAGHELTVLVRDASKLKLSDAKLRVLTGDAADPDAVASAVKGAEAVVSCLGHVPGGACPMMSVAFSNILQAAAQEPSPPRCVLMTTIGVGRTSAFVKCVLSSFVAGWKVIADYERADELVRSKHGEVPFVLVRPGHLTDGAASGKYKASLKGFYHIGMKISRQDVADFLLRAASSSEFENKAVQLFA